MMADQKAVLRLLKTARGQIDGIIRMVEEDRYCMDIVNQLAAAESLLHKARQEVLRAHLECCVRETIECGDESERIRKLDEIISLLDKTDK